MMHEYNTVHGFELARGNTDKLNEIRCKGGHLGGAMDRARQPHEYPTSSIQSTVARLKT